jgi:hypothetical protein
MDDTVTQPEQRRPWLVPVCLLVGLTAGAIGANMVGRSVALRHAYPRGVMNLMQHHLASMQRALRSGQCSAGAAHLDRLDAIDGEITEAFADTQTDAGFAQATQHLREAVARARAAAPQDCRALAAAIEPIGRACDDCHHRYR